MRLQDYDTKTRYQAKVLGSERITAVVSNEEVRDISIEVESQDFDAQVGQNVGVLAPGQTEIGQEHHFRLYSVADLPHVTMDSHQRFSICVRRCSYIDEFSGEAVAPMVELLGAQVESGFNRCAQGLKARAEALYAQR